MNILIVTAHPSSLGHTHRIANTYKQEKEKKGHSVVLVDLYAQENALPFMKFEKIKDMPISRVQKKFHEQLTWADEIVVIHPIWWGLPPAIMKNWIDHTIWPGVGYKYMPNGKVAKLLNGKTAKIFATSGNSGWWHYLLILPLTSFWKLCVFGFCGAEVVDVKVCGNLDKWRNNQEKCDACFEKFLLSVKNSA